MCTVWIFWIKKSKVLKAADYKRWRTFARVVLVSSLAGGGNLHTVNRVPLKQPFIVILTLCLFD